MNLASRPFALFVLSLFVLARLHASALTWEKNKISMAIMQGEQTEVKATFPFKNSGSLPVTITGAQPSCGCTTAGLKKNTYAPGESGKIEVVFHPAGRTGLQEKYITVTTNELNQPPTRLLLEVNIKQYLTIEPHYLAWRAGGKPAEQLIVVSALPSQPITGVTAQGTPAGTFETRIEAVEKGQKYNVYVKPVSTADRLTAAIIIQAKFSTVAEQKAEAYVYVNPPGVSQTDD
jgi:hypothetical protein